ncbi:hypothetical protein PTET_b0752 [Pseudoalteromonas tetraodonis]|nr:hypothetical protein PTET_b0752 [Pseudoalteromonas tetraodonis]
MRITKIDILTYYLTFKIPTILTGKLLIFVIFAVYCTGFVFITVKGTL